MTTADRYRGFAETEAHGYSPCYERWCRGIAGDAELLALIDALPTPKRQPNLILGAARYLGAVVSGFEEFKDFLIRNWPEIRDVAMTHRTQTNEGGRTATLLPLLARYPGHPVALIEFGASAGLCLYPDRYSYRYDDGPILDPKDGRSEVVLPCATTGTPPLPGELPWVVHRAGIDLNPLDVRDPEDMRWLESLIWPEQRDRLSRLRNAAAIARRDPPTLVTGDLTTTLTDLVHAAPQDIPVIVFGSAVLAYLTREDRNTFRDTIAALPCHWITNEAAGALNYGPVPAPPRPGQFLLTSDGAPVAYTGPHGQVLDWFA
ncbi:DUF2332 domain-containing protein [Nocardia sp. NPDC004722]